MEILTAGLKTLSSSDWHNFSSCCYFCWTNRLIGFYFEALGEAIQMNLGEERIWSRLNQTVIFFCFCFFVFKSLFLLWQRNVDICSPFFNCQTRINEKSPHVYREQSEKRRSDERQQRQITWIQIWSRGRKVGGAAAAWFTGRLPVNVVSVHQVNYWHKLTRLPDLRSSSREASLNWSWRYSPRQPI